MGATVHGIVLMLCKDFIRLVVLGIMIGFPIGYYVGEHFLSKYAFHAEINIWIFLLTAIGMILTTLLIVSYQSVKTALTNPVNVFLNLSIIVFFTSSDFEYFILYYYLNIILLITTP